MSIREQVPKPLRGPVGFGSLGLMIVSVAVGYILTVLGLIFSLGLNAPQGLTTNEALGVLTVGIICLVISYGSWRGFTYFAY